MTKVSAAALALLMFSAGANAIDVGIGAKAGINGLGVDLSVGLTKNVNLRLSVAQLDIEGEEETITVGDSGGEGDIAAELDFDYGANAVFLDWHALGGGFRLTAGMLKNNGAADLTGTLQSTVIIDGTTVTTGDLGEITGEVSLSESYQPYIGIGWGRGAGGGGGFSFNADIGVALLEASVDLNATATGSLSQAELDAALDGMASDAEQDLEDLELWPVFAIGINYAF